MANYSLQDIKDLREKTGAGMLDVKKALEEAAAPAEAEPLAEWERELLAGAEAPAAEAPAAEAVPAEQSSADEAAPVAEAAEAPSGEAVAPGEDAAPAADVADVAEPTATDDDAK